MNARETAQRAVERLKEAASEITVAPRTLEIGRVLSSGDGIARVSGLPSARAQELLQFPRGVMGLAFNLDEDEIGCVLMGDDTQIFAGDTVRCTGQVVRAIWSKFPAGDPGRHRLLGVAMPEGVHLAYGRGEEFTDRWIANPHYGTFTPADLTGAGDCFRAGVYGEVMRHADDFAAGRLDLARTGRAGHDAACEYLRP